MPATYEPIATTTLSSATTTITFSSIPSTYTDLRLIVVGTLATAGGICVRFNNDTAANYSNRDISTYGSTVINGAYQNNTTIRCGYFGTTEPAMLIADIFSYAGSTNKTMLTNYSDDRNSASGSTGRSVSLWRNTSAINRIDFYNIDNYNLSIGTTATLYGILKA